MPLASAVMPLAHRGLRAQEAYGLTQRPLARIGLLRTHPKWWTTLRGSNPRPSACQTDALPAELSARCQRAGALPLSYVPCSNECLRWDSNRGTRARKNPLGGPRRGPSSQRKPLRANSAEELHLEHRLLPVLQAGGKEGATHHRESPALHMHTRPGSRAAGGARSGAVQIRGFPSFCPPPPAPLRATTSLRPCHTVVLVVLVVP